MQPATHSRLRSNSIVSPLSGTYPGISSSLRSLAVLLPGMTLSPIWHRTGRRRKAGYRSNISSRLRLSLSRSLSRKAEDACF
jgi:hypothetical protein